MVLVKAMVIVWHHAMQELHRSGGQTSIRMLRGKASTEIPSMRD